MFDNRYDSYSISEPVLSKVAESCQNKPICISCNVTHSIVASPV